MIAVRIPSALRPYAESQKEISVEAGSVDQALQVLTGRFPALAPHLYDETGTLRQYVNLFVNEQDVRNLQGGATPLKAGDRMMIVPSIAGGSAAWRSWCGSALQAGRAGHATQSLPGVGGSAGWQPWAPTCPSATSPRPGRPKHKSRICL